MDINVLQIQHKNSDDFFRGFYKEKAVPVYGCQLQRMFESKAAMDGDFLVLEIDGNPFMQVEFYRTGSRRILSTNPRFALGLDECYIENHLSAVFQKLIEYIADYEEFQGRGLKLALELDEAFPFFAQLADVLATERRFVAGGSTVVYRLDPALIAEEGELSNSELSWQQFVSRDLDFRYNLISQYDDNVKEYGCHIETLYQDYIEEGQICEKLWEMLFQQGELAGYMLPLVNSGALKETVLARYEIIEDTGRRDVFKEMLRKLKMVAMAYGSDYIKVKIKERDRELAGLLDSYHAEKLKSYSSFRFVCL